MQILLGCGNSRVRKLGEGDWSNLVTLDLNPSCGADVIHDMESLPLPFADNSADEIHAYEVLEHQSRQGDWRFFFDQFSDFWRVLKHGGKLYLTVPSPLGPWALGDPGHCRIIHPYMIYFLSQSAYGQIDQGSPMTDYRWYYHADFNIVHLQTTEFFTEIILEAVK